MFNAIKAKLTLSAIQKFKAALVGGGIGDFKVANLNVLARGGEEFEIGYLELSYNFPDTSVIANDGKFEMESGEDSEFSLIIKDLTITRKGEQSSIELLETSHVCEIKEFMLLFPWEVMAEMASLEPEYEVVLNKDGTRTRHYKS